MSRNQRRDGTMKLNTKLAIAGFASALLFAPPAMSAPISVFPKDLVRLLAADENQLAVDENELAVDDNQIVQVRGGRGGGYRGGGGGYRGGGYRGGAVRGGAAYRGGAVVRRGAAVVGAGAY